MLPSWAGSWLYPRLERLSRDICASLFDVTVIDEEKRFKTWTPGADFINILKA
jgi:hypothetical protein